MGRPTDPGENSDPGNDDQHLARPLTKAPRFENSLGRKQLLRYHEEGATYAGDAGMASHRVAVGQTVVADSRSPGVVVPPDRKIRTDFQQLAKPLRQSGAPCDKSIAPQQHRRWQPSCCTD